MRPGFVFDGEEIVEEAVRKEDPLSVFHIGERFVFGHDVDMEAYGIIPRLTVGTVVEYDYETGRVTMDLDGSTIAWVDLVPYDTPELLDALNAGLRRGLYAPCITHTPSFSHH